MKNIEGILTSSAWMKTVGERAMPPEAIFRKITQWGAGGRKCV